MQLKHRLRLGQTVQYFHCDENRVIQGTLLELRRTSVIIRDQLDKKKYRIPYFMLNIDQRETTIRPTPAMTLNANNLSVHDWVGFKKDGLEIVGKIKRLNQKTVTMQTKDGHIWRVAYAYLFRVTDSTLADTQNFITVDGGCNEAN